MLKKENICLQIKGSKGNRSNNMLINKNPRWRGYFIRAHFKILFTIIYLHLLFLPFIVARIANLRELGNSKFNKLQEQFDKLNSELKIIFENYFYK